jgi:hypothetical protein
MMAGRLRWLVGDRVDLGDDRLSDVIENSP